MLHVLFSLALAPLVVAADAALPVGTQLSYRGSVEAVSEDADASPKTFDLTLWILSASETGSEVFWLVDERGNGEFPWPSRFGTATLDPRYRTSMASPALLYDRGEGQSIVPVLWPFLSPAEPLAAGATFTQGKLEFQVDKATKRGEQAAWHVSVSDPFGPKRTLVVAQQGPLVLEMDERLTMGRGQPYRLQLELVDSQQLSKGAIDALTRTVESAHSLRNKLNLASQSQDIQWKPEQAELLAKELPALVELAAGTPLSKLVTAANRDLELQAGRNDAVATMQARFVGHPVEEFSIRGTAGETLRAEDLKGKITVLHFWDYRDEPLREPYGQVGYLDFLYHRHKTAGLQVYGVAVNPRLSDESTRAAAVRSTKKLKSFMNLSYPVLLDEGGLLRQFGDPRVVGASLPLFVVVGPEGTILHYHVGTYDVQQDQGLKELDAVAAELLSKDAR